MLRTPESGINLFVTLREELLATKESRDAQFAAVIDAVLKLRGSDLRYNPNNADFFTKVFPQISLPEEHRRQGLINARKYAGVLGMGQDEYIATLPQFPGRPGVYETELGLTVPVIMENRHPWLKLAELSAISVTDYLRAKEAEGVVKDWEKDDFQMQQCAAISMWVQDGTKLVNRKPRDVRNELLQNREYKKHYKAGRISVGSALWNARPDMVTTTFWDLIGTSVGSAHCAFLFRWDVQAGLYAGGLDFADSDFRALVFGSKIEIMPLAV